MKNFKEIIEKVLHHEGGYVNDPKDLGGETKYGITKELVSLTWPEITWGNRS